MKFLENPLYRLYTADLSSFIASITGLSGLRFDFNESFQRSLWTFKPVERISFSEVTPCWAHHGLLRVAPSHSIPMDHPRFNSGADPDLDLVLWNYMPGLNLILAWIQSVMGQPCFFNTSG